MDPCLKLFYKCPMMQTENKDVGNGQGNGSVITVEGVVVKPGEFTRKVRIDTGHLVHAVYASQVELVTVMHANPKISPSVLLSSPRVFRFLRACHFLDVCRPKIATVTGSK